ncbi:GrpB family protein [Clostridium sp. UBA1056]|uniref:GrpB family protein n=1 Tax=unclassified Clostridium TaxID=2614128 RepID=UPI0032162C7F
MIGLSRGIVKLAPYTDQWKDEFNKEKNLLSSVVGDYVLAIEHVGSTSIKGLDSKPIIDIAMGVKSLNVVNDFRELLESIGYNYRGDGGIEGRVLFAKGSEELRTHYLHVEAINSNMWKNHIYFRDYLRLHSDYVNEYSKLKNELALKFADDRSAYTKEKDKFISMVLEKAMKEFSKDMIL